MATTTLQFIKDILSTVTSASSLKKDAIVNMTVDGKVITYTKGDDSTGTITTQDTTYSVATKDSDGLLSKEDKVKLDGVSTYTLPPASASTIGGVKVASNAHLTLAADGGLSLSSSNVTDALGYTPPQQDTTYTASTSAPLVAGTAAAGTSTEYARADHVHPAQTNISGTAAKATADASGNTITSTYATKTELANVREGLFTVVTELPTAGEKGVVYLIKTGSETNNEYTEYVYINSKWEKLGTQQLDLTNYVKKADAITGLSVSGTTITYTKGDNSTGTITTQDTNTNSITKLIAGLSTSTANAAATNGNMYLRLFDDSTARSSLKVSGGGATTVASDANGNITITTPAVTDTHYTTKLIAGISTSTANAASTNGNTYLRLFDDTTARNSINIKGNGATTVTSDANGVITINSTNTTYNDMTAATADAAGTHGLVPAPAAGDQAKVLSGAGTWVAQTTDTHYTTKLIAGASNSTANAATENGNTYLRLFDNTTARNSINIKGTGGTTVTSDANGVITINSTDNNTDTLVTQNISTANNTYPILLVATANANANQGAKTTIFASGVKVNPSTSTITATTFSGNATTATTATTLANSRNFSLTGDVTASAVSFNGSGNVELSTTLATSGVTAGNYGPSANATPAHSGTFSVPYITVDAKGRITAASTKTITLPASGNTNYTATLLVGATGTATDASTSNGATYLKLYENSTVRSNVKLTGSGGTTVASDASKVITITSPSLASATPVAAALTGAVGTGTTAARADHKHPHPTYRESKYVTLSGTAINLSQGDYFYKVLSANTTFTITNLPAAGVVRNITVVIVNNGSYTVTWPSTVTWAGGSAPTLNSGTNIFTFTILGE